MTTIAPNVTLNTSQLQTLQNLTAAENFPAAYLYLRDLANQAAAAAPTVQQRDDLNSSATWLDRAASINANDGSFTSEFVRGATAEMASQMGKPIT
jgi:hypothetical protein